MSELDEHLALAYLVNCDQHVKRWREAGGPWQPSMVRFPSQR
jgi:hypothetical protein